MVQMADGAGSENKIEHPQTHPQNNNDGPVTWTRAHVFYRVFILDLFLNNTTFRNDYTLQNRNLRNCITAAHVCSARLGILHFERQPTPG